MASPGRFVYVIAPYLNQWEVTFGDGGSCFIYDTRDEAIEIARLAARAHWETKGEPAGVRLEVPGAVRDVIATYGTFDVPPPGRTG
jgi:hypothetical protein